MLSRLLISFLPRSKRLLISWLQSPSIVILEPPKIKSLTVSIVSPSICHEVMGPDAVILVFWMLSFKPTFSLYPFAFIKKLFSSSSLSAIRVVSPVCLRLLIFLLAILIPACASSSLAFHMMYSAHKLNKQGDNIQPWRTPLEYVSILKSRDVTLPTKVCLVKAMVFPVFMYGCESWTVKKSTEELKLLNCDVGEDSWESLELQGDQTSQS